MNEQSIARRYAKAIFELALENNALEASGSELALAGEIMAKTPELIESQESTELTRQQKRDILEGFVKELGAGEIVSNSLRLLGERGRLREVPAVATAFRDMKDEHDGVVRGHVTSAFPLKDGDLNAIADRLGRQLGKRVLVEASVDSSLLGGIVLEVAGKTMDGSILGSLKALGRSLRTA